MRSRPSRGGGTTHPGGPKDLGGGAPALSGLVGQPKKALCAIGIKSKRKKRRRWEREEGLHLSNQVGLGLGGGRPSPLARPTPLGVLGTQGKAPPPPPIYTEVLGLI